MGIIIQFPDYFERRDEVEYFKGDYDCENGGAVGGDGVAPVMGEKAGDKFVAESFSLVCKTIMQLRGRKSVLGVQHAPSCD